MKQLLTTAIALLFFVFESIAGPCNTIIPITCGTPVTFSVPAVAGDPMFPTGLGSCGASSFSNGLEIIYKFTAPSTGLYQFGTTTATTSIVQYSYKSAGLPCDSSGWKCIGYTKVATPLGSMLLNANDSIYILANSSVIAAIQQTFQISCALPLVCNTIKPLYVDTTNIDTFAAGYGNPLFPNNLGSNSSCNVFSSQGGTEKMYKLVATQDGFYQFTSSYNSQIAFLYKNAALGCDSSAFTCLGLSTATGQYLGSVFLNAGDSILVLLNSANTGGSLSQFKVTIRPTYCNNIIPITCGVQNLFSTTAIDSSQVGYNNGMGTNCYQTAGRGALATIYKLKAPLSGTYQLSTAAATSGVIEYFYKNAALGCDPTGWQCINYTALAIPNLGSISMTAGDSILLLVKAEKKLNVSQSQYFQLSCPTGCPPLDTPVLVNSNASVNFCKGDSLTLSLSPAVPASAALTWNFIDYYSNDKVSSYQNSFVVKNRGYIYYTINYCGTSLSGGYINYYAIDTLPTITISTPVPRQCAISNPSFKFTCTNTFYYPVHYTWKRNGVTVGSDSVSFTTNLAGTYTVEVSSGCGLPKTSNSVVTTIRPAYTGARPHLVFTGTNPFCSTDTTATLSIPPIPNGMQYTLYAIGLGSGTQSSSSTFKASSYYYGNSTYSYYIEAIDSCGQHIFSDTLLGVYKKINPLSPISISNSTATTLCDNKGGVRLYVVAPTYGTSYDWKLNGISQNVQTSAVLINNTTVVTLSLSNVCGTVNSSNSVSVVILPSSPVTYQTASICPGSSYSFYGQTLTSAGTYTKLFYNVAGCDSLISLDLSLYPTPAKPIIIQNGNTLSVQGSYNSYQWYLWQNPFSNSNQVTVTDGGNYTVKVTNANGCESTSDPYQFIPNGLLDVDNQYFTISPNPVRNQLEINGLGSNIEYKIIVTDMHGREVMKMKTVESNINVEDLKNGIYFLNITLPTNQNIVKRFVKLVD